MQNVINKIISETTFQSDISYLPSGFTSIQSILKSMAATKSKWKIQILDDLYYDRKVVEFEDYLRVGVDDKHWDDFKNRVIGSSDVKSEMTIDLSSYLTEAIKTVVDKAYKELHKSLVNMLYGNREVSETHRHWVGWAIEFPLNVYTASGQILLRVHEYDKACKILESKLMKEYDDDIGTIEMIADYINNGKPLNTFEVFNDFDYLYGDIVESNYRSVRLAFESVVSMAFVPSERVSIFNAKDILDEIEENDDSVKVSGNSVYPKDKRFDVSFYKTLKSIIEEVE